jgi:hypothetical protein
VNEISLYPHSQGRDEQHKPITYLFLILLPYFQHFLVGETDTVHSLQSVVVCVSEPVGSRMARCCKRLDFPGVNYVRSPTEINQVTTSIHSSATIIGDFCFQDRLLERIVRKEFETFFFGDHHALKLLFLLDNLIHLLFYRFIYNKRNG